MFFNIHDITDYTPEEIENLIHEKSEGNKVELSLSPGETRQALMDRVRNDVLLGEYYFLNLNFQPHNLTVTQEDVESQENARSVILDIENILYDLPDEDFDNSVWGFSNEKILVQEEK